MAIQINNLDLEDFHKSVVGDVDFHRWVFGSVFAKGMVGEATQGEREALRDASNKTRRAADASLEGGGYEKFLYAAKIEGSIRDRILAKYEDAYEKYKQKKETK